MSVSKNVQFLMEMFPNLDSNNRLAFLYWSIFDNVKNPEDIMKATPIETITRNYRRLKSKEPAVSVNTDIEDSDFKNMM